MGAGCCSERTISVYEKLGGEKAVRTAVRILYEKILEDDRINWMFEDIDWEAQKDHQTRFLSFAFGGPNTYAGRSLSDAHSEINNGDYPEEIHFTAVAECLIATPKDLSIPTTMIDEVVKIVLSVKDDVMGVKENKKAELLKKRKSIKQAFAAVEKIAVCPQQD